SFKSANNSVARATASILSSEADCVIAHTLRYLLHHSACRSRLVAAASLDPAARFARGALFYMFAALFCAGRRVQATSVFGVCPGRRTPEPEAPRGNASRSAKPVLCNDIDRLVLRCALVVVPSALDDDLSFPQRIRSAAYRRPPRSAGSSRKRALNLRSLV